MNAQLGGSVELNNVSISTIAADGIGARITDGGSLEFGATHIWTLGREAHGLLLMGLNATQRATAEVSDSTITTRGDASIGINVNRHATAQVINTQITTTGNNSGGVWLPGETNDATLRQVRITTSGNNSVGVSSQGGTAILSNIAISTAGTQSHGLYASGSTARMDATNINISLDKIGAGVFAIDNSVINLDTGSVTTREGGIGLYAARGGNISAADFLINAEGDGGRALVAANGATLTLGRVHASANGVSGAALQSIAGASTQLNNVSMEDGSLTATKGSAIAVLGGQLDLSLKNVTVTGQQVLDVNQSATGVAHGNVNVTAQNSLLVGDVRVAGASSGDTRLQLDRSVLTGAVQGLDQLDLLNSQWNMTADSRLVGLNNQGTVAFETGAGFKTLTLEGDLTGGGTFVMNTDLAGLRGDLLHILGTTQGNHTLAVADSGKEPAKADEKLMLVNGNGGDGRFALAGRPHVDAGAFRYTLEQQGDDWFLRNTSLRPGPDNISDGSNAALGSQAAAATLWAAEMNALVKRLGELRMGNDKGGVWTRGIGKTYKIDNGYGRGFEQSVRGMEVGADSGIDRQGGTLYLGGMVGMATSSQNFGDGGSGEIDSQLLGIYSTWMDDSGYYIDAVGKYNRFSNQVKTLTNTGERVKGSYKTRGLGADVEVGKHIALQDAWFVEPQLELTYTYTHGANYTASNGLAVRTQAADSLQTRLGGLLGKSLTLDNGMAAQPYVKASYVQEFEGASTVKVNGRKLRNQVADSRAEIGLGGVLQVSAKTKVSLDVQHTKGEQMEEPWAVNMGVRYLW
ncbi:autotransporter outer membrane beta-barrel domain-containing protein [Pseudomonas turukhanskensis]|uniref:autotransporter outer membrane beta-barrel domain-containing protein n=1 Tax=Pseudomonas turukhanskensis TaxID=1806536 RepID=UPI0022F2FB16|nr:autotransporter outer membrane beta-barrel domain-containing protein [Pseudomonas turukhanskensis]